MGSASRSRQSSSSEPWKAQQPYLRDLYSRAKTYSQGDPSSRIAQRGIPDYLASRAGYTYGLSSPQVGQPGFHGVGFDNIPLEFGQPGFQSVGLERSKFIDELGQRSRRGIINPATGLLLSQGTSDPRNRYFSALDRFQNTETNPYLRDLYRQGAEGITDTFQRDVLPGIHAGFGAGGRTGSGAHAGAVGQAAEGLTGQLADLSERLYGSAYETDRDRALRAATTGGQLYSQGLGQNIGALSSAGGLHNVEAGQNLNALLGAAGEFGSQEQRKIGAFEASTARQNNLAQQALAKAGLDINAYDAATRRGLGAFDASTRRQGGLAQQALQRAQFGDQAARDRLGILTGLADRDRGYRQEFLNAPFNQLAQYSNLIGNPVLTNRSSGSSKGLGIG